jgi:UDP-glucose 4-epimerase
MAFELFKRSGADSPRSPTLSESSSGVHTPATGRSVLFDDTFETNIDDLTLNNQYILVTGGLGFIGSHTSLELLKSGYNVIIIDDLSNSFQTVFDRVLLLAQRHHTSQGSKCPTLQLHDVDYRNLPALRSLLDAHKITNPWDTIERSSILGVIHFAAFKAVEESIRHPLKYYANNVSGLIDFTSTLSTYNIKKFIFSSSATVYGTLANQGVPLREEHCVHRPETFPGTNQLIEQGCTGITNPYGRTKWMCEAILSDLAFSDPTWTIVALRYFNPIGCDASGLLGEDPKGIPTNLLPVVVKVMTGQYDQLSMFGTDWDTPDGTAVRDFIHVTDLARGHIAALATATKGGLKENFRTFNLGTGNGNSVTDVVEAMEQVSNKEINRVKVGRREGDVGSCVAMAGRSREELGWRTEKSLRDACVDIVNFLGVREGEELEKVKVQLLQPPQVVVTAEA